MAEKRTRNEERCRSGRKGHQRDQVAEIGCFSFFSYAWGTKLKTKK